MSHSAPAAGRSGLMALRQRYNALIDSLQALGRSDEAGAVARLAIEQGMWKRPDQRPIHFVPELPAAPVHDPGLIYLARFLERHAQEIADEARAVIGAADGALLPVEEPLVAAGAWDMAAFYEGGERSRVVGKRFPRIAAILERAPDDVRQAGLVMLSLLEPGTHIVPHCGFSNVRLRIHLCLQGDPAAHIRIGAEQHGWVEGRCLVFDDSFEHEVRHDGTQPRLVLLADCFHPALPRSGRAEFVRAFAFDRWRNAKALMRERQLRSFALTPGDDRLLVRFDPEFDRQIRRHIAEGGGDELHLADDGTITFFGGGDT